MKTELLIKLTFLLVLLNFPVLTMAQPDFITKQKKFDHVQAAFEAKEQLIIQKLKSEKIDLAKLNILIVAYKNEGELILFAKNKGDVRYKRIEMFPVCASSGQPGPKRAQGDMQVPEGFYAIRDFNPVSNYYLSLGISYPNPSDLMKTKAKDPGGDIYIHGNCVTIGCLPITDDKIKELYIYAIQSRQNGQTNIPVYIFPYKMNEANTKLFAAKYKNDHALPDFWANLKTGYDIFEKQKQELTISYDKQGNYLFR